MACDGPIAAAMAQATTPAATRWRGAIDKIKRTSTPYQLELADAVAEELGGLPEIAARMAADIKEMRGEGLPKESREFFEPDRKTLKGMYELIMRLMQNRDEFINAADPLQGLTEEELIATASQACFSQIRVDSTFRAAVLQVIAECDSEQLIAAAVALIAPQPRVLVSNG